MNSEGYTETTLNELEDEYYNTLSKRRPWLQIPKETLYKLKKENPGVANKDLPLIVCAFDNHNKHSGCPHKEKCRLWR